MADTVVGTAGLFVTLAIIALVSFVVGLAVFAVMDYTKHVSHHRKRSRRKRTHAHAAPLRLADKIQLAAMHDADALFVSQQIHDPDPDQRWAVALEIACALTRIVDGHLIVRHPHEMDSENGSRLLQDLVAGSLYRALPKDSHRPVLGPVSSRLAEYRQLGGDFRDLYRLAVPFLDACASHIVAEAPLLGAMNVDRLTRSLTELMSAALTVDLARDIDG